TEELDTEAERIPVGHPAHVAHDHRRSFGCARYEARVHTRRVGRQARGSIEEEVDEAFEQADDLLGLPGRGRAEVDALEVECPESGKRAGRGLGHSHVARRVDSVEHGTYEG